MQEPERTVWFPVKRYGWGWGFPVVWQGWVFLLGWFAAFVGGVAYVQANSLPQWLFWAFVVGMTSLLLAVCFAKGDKPRWRWGD